MFSVVLLMFCMFVSQVIVGHGEPAPRLCNKDPFALKSLSYLSRIFPKAKFVLMLRDGRATVHSMISRKVCLVLFLIRAAASPQAGCLSSRDVATLWPNNRCHDSCGDPHSGSFHRWPSLVLTWPVTGTALPSGAVQWRPCSASVRQLGKPSAVLFAMSSLSSTQRRKWESCCTS